MFSESARRYCSEEHTHGESRIGGAHGKAC